MDATVLDFVGYAEAIGYRLAPAPISRAHLPPISSWIDVYEPAGRFVGVGIVIAYDPDPHKIVVQIDGARHITHYADCDWVQVEGAGSCP